MAKLIKKFNSGGTTSSSISRQFTPEFVSKAVVEYAARKQFFSKMASREDMPENSGDTITKEIVIPMLHKDNMVDGNVDASTADQNGGLYLMGEFNQNHIIFDNSWAIPALKTAFRPLAIFLKDSTQAPVATS